MYTELDTARLKIKHKDLIRACCRAIYLWEFGEDSVNKKYRKTDKQMMKYFGGIWTRYTKTKRKNVRYTVKELQNLMHSCMIERQVNNKELGQIGNHLSNQSVLISHNYVINLPVQITGRLATAAKLTDNLATFLNIGKGNQPALASRLLFFSMPHLHFYNYSQPLVANLKKNFKFKIDTVDDVFDAMHKLHQANKVELKNLPRPKFSEVKGIATAINEGDWWERRVLDLAVLQNWDCFCKD
jgi:hypothetical protein